MSHKRWAKTQKDRGGGGGCGAKRRGGGPNSACSGKSKPRAKKNPTKEMTVVFGGWGVANLEGGEKKRTKFSKNLKKNGVGHLLGGPKGAKKKKSFPTDFGMGKKKERFLVVFITGRAMEDPRSKRQVHEKGAKKRERREKGGMREETN